MMRTDTELRDHYDELHRTDELRFPKEDYPVFFDWLNLPGDTASLRLLDVACGQGFFLESVERVTRNVQLDGVDFSPVALDRARPKLHRTRLIEASAYHLPYPDGTFDYVTNLGSLEHFARPVDALRELGRVIKPTGKGMLIVPNRYYLGNLWQVYAYGEEDDQGQEGVCTFKTAKAWEHDIRQAALDPIAVRGYNGEDHIAWFFKRKSGEITGMELICRQLLDAVLKPGIPLNLSQCFVFFVRRQPAEGASSRA